MLTPTAAKAAHLMTTATRTTDTPTASTATEVTATLMADTDTVGTDTAGTGTPTAAGVEAWMPIWEVCVYGDALKTGVCGKPDKILMFFFYFHRCFSPCPGWHIGKRGRDHLHHPHSPVRLVDRWPDLLALHCHAHFSQRHPSDEGRLWGSPSTIAPRKWEGLEQRAGKGKESHMMSTKILQFSSTGRDFTALQTVSIMKEGAGIWANLINISFNYVRWMVAVYTLKLGQGASF